MRRFQMKKKKVNRENQNEYSPIPILTKERDVRNHARNVLSLAA